MTLSLVNNVSALNAQNNLGRASSSLNTSIERLSSGFRINRGADGPAALVISEQQRAQIAGLRTAIDNTEKAVAVVQTAEGALGEINSLLVQVRSLAIDSANTGVNDEDALAANQAEIANALETIDRIATSTQFGESRLLDGSAGITGTSSDAALTFQSAGDATPSGTFEVNVTTAAEQAVVTGSGGGTLAADETLTLNDVSISLASGATQADVVERINDFSDETGVNAEVVGGEIQLNTTEFGEAATISVISTGTGAGFSTTEATDEGVDIEGTIGGDAATGTGNVLVGTAGDAEGVEVAVGLAAGANETATGTGDIGDLEITNNSLVFQVGANAGQTVSIAVDSVASSNLGAGVEGNSFANLSQIDVQSAQGAQDALGVLDAAIDEVSNLRGTLGAFQGNTLESTANNIRTTLENTVNAESVIRDTDFAEEISNFTNSQVLVQAGTSVLSNANQSSQLILSLLG